MEHTKQEAKLIALQGCPIGTLCQALAKDGGILAHLVAKILMDFLLWAEAQFFDLGFKEEASDLSLELTYQLQGIFLLGFAFKDSKLIIRQITLLQAQIKELLPTHIIENEAIPILA